MSELPKDEQASWMAKLWHRRLTGVWRVLSIVCAIAWIGVALSFILRPPTPRPGTATVFHNLAIWQLNFFLVAGLMLISHVFNRLTIVAHAWAAGTLTYFAVTLAFAAVATKTGWSTPSFLLMPTALHVVLAERALPKELVGQLEVDEVEEL